ncbi:helix-turn-helix transcriptional regulator [Thermopolyspora sp. NPDC052614]|uniref:helix-turn-helix domain-containing protein n=1 Tax=Thermopolyspora sp. NPDC052614 TaxID=3155682 RepID=UPI003443D1A9
MNVVPSLDPGSPRVRFGMEMRRLREMAELSQAAVAARLGCTQTQVSRLEKATRTPSRSDAEKLDKLFGTTNGISFVRLHERILMRPGSPSWFQDWAEEVEPTATVLRSWDPLLIPGLLQTEAYARHIFSQGLQGTPEQVEASVEARISRRRILDRENPPNVLVLIDQGVLHRRIGSNEIMREQLGHLLEMTQRPTVFVQIVDPECVAGLAGNFAMAEFPDGQPNVVQADSPTQGYITADYDIVTSVWQRYEAIRRWAYPERVSLQMIEKARREWT